MEATPKKWFVHTGSAQEGPLSPEEVHERLRSKKLELSHFAWAAGMANWIPISTVPELNVTPPEAPVSIPAAPVPPPLDVSGNSQKDLSALIEIGKDSKLDATGFIDRSALKAANKEAVVAEHTERKARAKAGSAVSPAGSLFRVVRLFLLLLFIIGGVGIAFILNSNPQQLGLSGLDPILKLIHKKKFELPALAEMNVLTAAERKQLEEAAQSDPALGVSLAIVGAVTAGQSSVLIAANLNDNTALDLKIESVKKRVIGVAAFSNTKSIVITKGFAKIDFTEKVPWGEYVTTVQRGDNKKVLSKSRLVLGGASGAGFEQALNAEHDRVITRVRDELKTLIEVTIRMQRFYEEIKAKDFPILLVSPSQISVKKSADSCQQKWSAALEVINKLLGNWRAETLKNDVLLWKQAQRVLMVRQRWIEVLQRVEEFLAAPSPKKNEFRKQLMALSESAEKETLDVKAALLEAENVAQTGDLFSLMEAE